VYRIALEVGFNLEGHAEEVAVLTQALDPAREGGAQVWACTRGRGWGCTMLHNAVRKCTCGVEHKASNLLEGEDGWLRLRVL
jgi:hypothetical protein